MSTPPRIACNQTRETQKWQTGKVPHINADDLDPFPPHLRDFKNVEELMLDGWVPPRLSDLENLSILWRIREEETTRVPTVSPRLSSRLMIECTRHTRTLLKTLCKLPLRFQKISLAYCYWGCQELIDACAETLVDFRMYSSIRHLRLSI